MCSAVHGADASLKCQTWFLMTLLCINRWNGITFAKQDKKQQTKILSSPSHYLVGSFLTIILQFSGRSESTVTYSQKLVSKGREQVRLDLVFLKP